MEEEKSIPKKYWILIVGIIAIVFVLGMILENVMMINKLNKFVKKYDLKDGGYQVAGESVACVFGNSSEMERFYSDTIIPALKGNPVCFVNSNPLGVNIKIIKEADENGII